MSKPSWDALADRYGAQSAEYALPEPQHTEERAMCRSRGCGWLAEPGALYCRGCQEANRLNEQRRRFEMGASAGQATVRLALALGAWLALVSACGRIVAATFGAAWIDGAWLAPFTGR